VVGRAALRRRRDAVHGPLRDDGIAARGAALGLARPLWPMPASEALAQWPDEPHLVRRRKRSRRALRLHARTSGADAEAMDTSPRGTTTSASLARLEHRLAGLAEPTLVLATFAEWMRACSENELLATFRHVFDRRPTGGCSFDALLDAVHAVLQLDVADGGLDHDVRVSLYAAANQAGDERMLRMLRQCRAMRSSGEKAGGLPRDLAEVPLGRRRSLAKGPDRRLLALLAQDSDPTVIRNLLRNPRMREPDVLRLASARPAHASALQEIGRDLRWARRTPIRTALARNPYTPVPLALQMLNGLTLRELRDIERDATLHADVRAHARDLADLRDKWSRIAEDERSPGCG
jgi:hypothetical protein